MNVKRLPDAIEPQAAELVPIPPPQINEAIIRYKPTPVDTPHWIETPIQPNDTKAFRDFDKRNNSKMFRKEKPLEPLRPNGCIGVSDSDTTKQGHEESEGINGAGWSIDL